MPPACSSHVASRPLRSHHDLPYLDKERFARLHQELLRRGIYLPPSCTDAACITLAHTEEIIARVVSQVREAWTATNEPG